MKKMKKFKIIIVLFTITSFLSSCNTTDDGYYNSVYLTIPNLVSIETQNSYSVNDYLYINSIINRLQTEAGQTSLLDLRKSTNNAPSFTFTYLLEKKINATDWEIVTLTTSNTNIPKGHIFYGGFYSAYADYNLTSEKYELRSGIKLETAGEYRLSFGYNSSSTNAVDLSSDSSENNIFVNINSLCNNLDSQGYYSFTVN